MKKRTRTPFIIAMIFIGIIVLSMLALLIVCLTESSPSYQEYPKASNAFATVDFQSAPSDAILSRVSGDINSKGKELQRSQHKEWQVFTEKDPLSIRESPSKDSKVVGYLEKGTIFRITKKSNDNQWGLLSMDNYLEGKKGAAPGWVNLHFCIDEPIYGKWGYLKEGEPYYHLRSCKELKKYNEEDIIMWHLDDAEFHGYKPCPVCGGW